VLTLFALGAALIASLLVPALDVGTRIKNNSNGEVSNVSYWWSNGTGEFYVWLAPEVPNTKAPDIACEVIRPTLKGTQFENTDFVVYRNDGLAAADQNTPCR
jgi:hypothetical protein